MDNLSIEHWRRKLDEDRYHLLIATSYINEEEKRSAILRALTALESDIKKLKEVAEQ